MLPKVRTRVLPSAVACALAACSVDERTLEPPHVDWIDVNAGGQPDETGGTSNAARGGTSGGKGGTGARAGTGNQGGAGALGGAAGNANGAGIGGSASAGVAGTGAGGSAPCTTDCPPLVSNGSFDRNAKGWSADDGIEQSWDKTDADSSRSSGSLAVTSEGLEDKDGVSVAGTAQCVAIDAGTDYHFAAQIRIDADQGEGSGAINAVFFGEPDCAGTSLDDRTSVVTATNAWLPAAIDRPTPAGSRSLELRLVVVRPYRNESFSASFDDVVLVER